MGCIKFENEMRKTINKKMKITTLNLILCLASN